LTSRAGVYVLTLTKQQVISKQTDEVDTARLGIVGPRDHGYLLVRKPMDKVGMIKLAYRSLLKTHC
jgi:hypothetical protein